MATKPKRQIIDPNEWAVTSSPQEEQQPQPQPQPAQQQQQQTTTPSKQADPFSDMLAKEYDLALEKEISKATSKVNERFTRLRSQQRNPDDIKKKDALGNTYDFYEDIVKSVRSKDPKLGKNREEVYTYLKQFDFTQMRDLNAIKQEYQQQQSIK